MSNWEKLPEKSRVWIYQSNKFLSDDACESLIDKAQTFVEGWSSHGSDLTAAAGIFHNLFLVLFVDEDRAGASGCSIDKSVRFVQQMEAEFNVSFFDRLNICLFQEGEKSLVPLSNLGEVKPGAQFFDNTIRSKQDLKERWLVPVSGSWLDRYVEVGA